MLVIKHFLRKDLEDDTALRRRPAPGAWLTVALAWVDCRQPAIQHRL